MRLFHRTGLIVLLACVTTIAISPLARAGVNLFILGGKAGSQYVTLSTHGTIDIMNLGASNAHIIAIASADQDAINGYFQLTVPTLPYTLGVGETLHVAYTFTPNGPTILAGERNFSAVYYVTSDAANSPTQFTLTGTGVLVRAKTSVSASYHNKVGDTLTIPVSFSSWDDPLGAASVRTLRVDVRHYRRTIVQVDPSFNTSGAGQVATLASGASVTEDIATDTMSDAAHTSGEQGYYSLIVKDLLSPLGKSGTLLNMRFFGIKGTDTSQLNYDVSDLRTAEGAVMPYVLLTNTVTGFITIDSLKKPSAVRDGQAPTQTALALQGNAPNPFTASTQLRYTLKDATHAELFVCDVRGHVVATLANGELAAGEHVAHFNAGTLPSGQYFAVLRTQSEIVKVDMALVR